MGDGREVEWGRGGRLFETGRLLTFSAYRMAAYSRWVLIRGWALIRINTVCIILGVNRVHYGLCENMRISSPLPFSPASILTEISVCHAG